MPLKESDIRFWNRVQELAKSNIKKTIYEYFIQPGKLISVNGNDVKIAVDSNFHKDVWARQTELLTTASLEIYGDFMNFQFVSSEELSESDKDNLNSQEAESVDGEEGTGVESSRIIPYKFDSNLQKRYTFDNFVEGGQNKMTLAATMAITDSPGNIYNPLFIFGHSGLGKTHLLHATGNEFLKKNRFAHVLYATTEGFVSDYVEATRKKKMEIFTNKYRNLDMLLIDDIQFISNKEGSINEFFNTFNALFDKGAQIVITSDRPPKDLQGLPERLVTRFTTGLPTQISLPDFETRMGILMNKVEKSNIKFPDETIAYIAGQVNSNVRELEGALHQVEFFAKVEKLDVADLATAEKALANVKSSNMEVKRSTLSSAKIKDEVAKYFHLPVSDLTGPKRIKDIAYARQVAMYLIRDMLGSSLPSIGRDFGKRDHTTVMYGVRVITEKLKTENDTQRDIDNLKRKLED